MVRRRGVLSEGAAAKLLMAAALLDLGLVYMMSKAISRSVPDSAAASLQAQGAVSEGAVQFLFNSAATAIPLAVFLLLAFVFNLVTEALFGGYTPGRAVMGLEMCQKNGAPLTRKSRLARGMLKLASFGVSGLQLSKLPNYDNAAGVAWSSTMAQATPQPPAQWKIIVRIPDGRSKSRALGDIAGFRRDQMIKIGRDPNWADIVLPRETQASGRHCVLRLNAGRIEVQDNDSSNGTRINSQRIASKTWVPLPPSGHFHAADVLCKIET